MRGSDAQRGQRDPHEGRDDDSRRRDSGDGGRLAFDRGLSAIYGSQLDDVYNEWSRLDQARDAFMHQLYVDITNYRVEHHRDPTLLLVSEQDWDTVIAGSYHYPSDAIWPHEKVFHNPATSPDHGTIWDIHACKDDTVEPGRAKIVGDQ